MINIARNTPKKLLLTLLLVGGVIAVVVVLEVTDTTHIFHKKADTTFRPTPTSGGASANNQKGEPLRTGTSTATQQTGAAQPGDQKSSSGSSTVTNLLAPSGDFVSAHGTSAYPIKSDAQLTSVCNTSPGAMCIISFSSAGFTKSLPEQTTDRGGSTYWNNWTPKSIGLTPGSWQVKAVAISGSQTKEAVDALELVIAP